MADRRAARWALRVLCAYARTRLLDIKGRERILPDRDPFILVLNHTQRAAALLISGLLTLLRSGKLIHFLSDWNFRLIPGAAQCLTLGETIVLTRKPARPRILNLLKPLFASPVSGFARARDCRQRGATIGIFPEGTINPDPATLLRGRSGAAWLSLTAGIPIVPGGFDFPPCRRDGRSRSSPRCP